MRFLVGLYSGCARQGEVTFHTLPATHSVDYLASPEGILSADEVEHVSWQLRGPLLVERGVVGRYIWRREEVCQDVRPAPPAIQPSASPHLEGASRDKEAAVPARLTDAEEQHETLTEMLLDLHANQAVLKQMRDWYGVFAFTGGAIPSGQCITLSLASYLDHPFATNRISVAMIERYCQLVEKAVRPSPVETTGPMALRFRKVHEDRFERAYREIQSLETCLASAITDLMTESTRSSEISLPRTFRADLATNARAVPRPLAIP